MWTRVMSRALSKQPSMNSSKALLTRPCSRMPRMLTPAGYVQNCVSLLLADILWQMFKFGGMGHCSERCFVDSAHYDDRWFDRVNAAKLSTEVPSKLFGVALEGFIIWYGGEFSKTVEKIICSLTKLLHCSVQSARSQRQYQGCVANRWGILGGQTR